MNYYDGIKKEFINNEVYKKAKDYSKNRSDLMTYFNVGKLLVEAQGGELKSKYGDKLIKEYSKKLTYELGRGYPITNLKYMRQFYIFQKSQAVPDQLTWSHYLELFKLKDNNEIEYYIQECIKNNYGYRQLRERIKLNEYVRLDEKTKEKLLQKEEYTYEIEDYIKHPVVIKNKYNALEISEKFLKQLILEDMDEFLLQLGSRICIYWK